VKVDYLSCRIVKSGGTKIISQHVRLLKERGHDARLVTTDPMGEDLWGIPVTRVKAYRKDFLGESDVLVGSWLRDVEAASRIEGPVICHLCQGYEPLELSLRITEETMPSKYRHGGLWKSLLFRRKRWSLQRRLRKIEETYRRETVKIVVSDYLKALLEKNYGAECYSVPNGIDPEIFRPSCKPVDYAEPLRLLSFGAMDIASKGVDDTLGAIKLLKQRGIPFEFIRVSLSPPTETEEKSGLVDRFLVGLDERKMVELYQRSHILIAPSLSEGFGLPAIEAMSCGLPCILTDSGSYQSLDPMMDFAYFVPPRSPEAIVEGVLKVREDRLFRERITKRGLEVAGRYTLKKMGNVLEETLLKILKGRKERSERDRYL
jgi:glycosyltransferase involved in cell wall biosynthesis